MVGGQHEARVVRAQTRGEHASSPRPPGGLQVLGYAARTTLLLFQNVDVPTGVNGLLLAWIRDLWDWMHAVLVPVSWRTNAAAVAVTHGEEDTVTPHSAVPRLNLQVLVHDDPATTAGALFADCLLRHEIVRSLHSDTNVGIVSTTWKFDLLEGIRRTP